jgi:hypothetical protein
MSLACAVRSSQRTEYHLYRTRRRRCVCAGYETRTGCALFTARDPESEDQLHQQRPRESKAATLLGFRAARPCTARGDTCEKTTHLALARERPCLRTCLQVAGEGDGYPCPFRKVDPAWLRVVRQNRRMIWPMIAVLRSLAMFIIDLFKSRRRLEVENLVLRHQLSIALRRAPACLRLRGSDRALLVWMTRLWPSTLGSVQVVQPERSFGGIARASRRSGGGNPEIGQGGRRSSVSYATLSAG